VGTAAVLCRGEMQPRNAIAILIQPERIPYRMESLKKSGIEVQPHLEYSSVDIHEYLILPLHFTKR
jgi:hypothetical protein